MTDAYKDLVITIQKAMKNGRGDVGIGEEEIFSLAYRIKKETKGELFGDVSFNYLHSNIDSPQLRDKLAFIRDDDMVTVLHEDIDGVEFTDIYYRLDIEEGSDLMDEINEKKGELDSDVEEAVIDVLDELEQNRKDFITSVDQEIRNSIRSEVEP